MDKADLRRRGVLAAVAPLLFGAVFRARATTEATAVAPIRQLIDSLVQIMKAGTATPFQKRYAMLAPVIDRTFDLEIILEESIGPSWAGLSPEQQAGLMNAFRRYTVCSYVSSFDDFDGQRFEVNPETRSVSDEQVVETKIIPRKGDRHTLDYVMRRGPAGWRVVDVLADGSISRVALQRSDFRRLLTRGGVQALAESLQMKSADLSSGSRARPGSSGS